MTTTTSDAGGARHSTKDVPTGLQGTRVLVVGTGPMGIAAADALIRHGAEVVLAGRSAERLHDVAVTRPLLRVRVCDFEHEDDAHRAIRDEAPVHVVVFGGGSAPSSAFGIATTPLDEAQRSFARFWMSYNALAAAARLLGEGSSVTLLSGSSSTRPSEGRGFWGSLHGAIDALGRNGAWELGPLRVNVISPGGIGVTPALRQLVPHAGTPHDIAAVLVMLIENQAITGAVVPVDGGEFLAAP